MTSIALQHRESILERIAAGEYLSSIAESIGLAGKGQAISNALASDPEYKAAREIGIEHRLSAREREMELAEKEDVPRARELLSHTRWRAERECPDRWGGQKMQVTINLGSVVDSSLQARASEVLTALQDVENAVDKSGERA